VEKKAKAEAKRARRNQRKLEGNANRPEEAEEIELKAPEENSTDEENAQ
jgi:hypothetical protein